MSLVKSKSRKTSPVIMELTIGRGEPSMQLCITSGKVKMLYGNEGSVARSVSRAHCKLTITDTGNIILENLKPENVTFVNGMAIVSKRINGNENVALGGDRYPLNWEYVNDFIQKVKDSAPKKCDLRPLKQVYETYHNATILLNKNERLFNSLGRGIPILTITGSVLGAMLGGQKVLIFSIIELVNFARSNITAACPRRS